ncbi:MAG: CsbD family protein [Undibacterium sp.]|nr:CsbD family protein [Opitutaceae bacterium]
MKVSTRNKAAGTANIVKGDAKQIAGKVLGKKILQAKGRAQEIAGKIQKAVGKSQQRDGN